MSKTHIGFLTAWTGGLIAGKMPMSLMGFIAVVIFLFVFLAIFERVTSEAKS